MVKRDELDVDEIEELLVDEPEEDMSEYVLLNSTDEAFKPAPWVLPEVRVLYDSYGRPLAFAAISKLHCLGRTRSSLPEEFFNHQLLELDYKDAEDFAAFMSKYGFIPSGSDAVISGYGTHRLIEDLAALDPYDQKTISAFEKKYDYRPKSYFSGFGTAWDDVYIHYAELKDAVAKISAKLEEAQPDKNILSEVRIRALVSVERAQYNFEDWLYCAKYLKAMACHKTRKDIAQALGENEAGIIRKCEGAVQIIQRHLDTIHPTLEILNIADDELYSSHGALYSGSFQQALALQFWKFTLEAKGGYTVCKECGQAFVHKQTKAKKTQSRNTSVFCCDKCKNRFYQRKHRQSEGYKLKMSRK